MQLEIISRKPASSARPTPLLFVHGAWHAAWCWAEYFLDYFAAHGYESSALSLRGHGGSEGHNRFAGQALMTMLLMWLTSLVNCLNLPYLSGTQWAAWLSRTI